MIGALVFLAIMGGGNVLLAVVALRHNRRFDARH
jgi:hypothetical protein